MPLVLEVLEAKEAAVGVSAPRSVVAAAVAFTHHLAVEGGFIHHLAASIRAEEWAGSIRLFTASTDLLVMVGSVGECMTVVQIVTCQMVGRVGAVTR